MICVDGGAGLLAALPMDPGDSRCWAHKIRNVLGKVKKADRAAKAGLHAIMNAQTVPEARSAARRFADRWHDTYPKAVDCLRNNLDELLTCWRYPTLDERKRVRTTNAIERRFQGNGAILDQYPRNVFRGTARPRPTPPERERRGPTRRRRARWPGTRLTRGSIAA